MHLPDHCQRGYIQVDLNKIKTNIENLHKLHPSETKVIAVIKADGYGHGAGAIGNALSETDAVYGFAVVTGDEASALRGQGITKPILVIGHVFPSNYEQMINEQITLSPFNENHFNRLQECAGKLNKTASIHLEIDTGMNRLGIRPDENGFLLIKKVLALPNIRIEGIYTHFARADEAQKEFTLNQLNKFRDFIKRLKNELNLDIPLKHASNSAGILGFHDQIFNLCRPGIAIYGIYPSEEAKGFTDGINLHQAMSLISQIIMLKDCETGEAVSYGGTYITSRKTKVATIPLGYGDGYPRSLSSVGHVLVRGRKAPVIGRICMDFFMVDVTDIEDVSEGDKVTLIGSDGDLSIKAEDVADLSGRFPYELICGFGKRIPRCYV
ncbi:MAG: alanine racemase [Lachnospiraceae bacterium]|nr:alanine racemase [Lachnospiraceae bacterium]